MLYPNILNTPQNAQNHLVLYETLTRTALQRAQEGIDKLEGQDLSPGDIKALTVTAATATDKTRLIAGLAPPSNKDNASIKALAQQFADLSQAQRKLEADHTAITDSVVSTQAPDNKE